ncbi:MAG TPA: hypothetical protein VFG68_06970 [Fimbriiglobus sp.]|nr:hypothetical protein [Fimbriiglobus sp.]
MATAPRVYDLEGGRLTAPPTQEIKVWSQEDLIPEFIKKYKSIDDRIVWTSPHARSGLVRHKHDPSLRIDFQKPANDPAGRPVQWANFQLQWGGDSLACVLLEMGLHYPAADVQAAWEHSLRDSRNARMVWRYVANRIEFAVLKSLDLTTPRKPDEIAREIRRWGGWGVPHVMGLEFQTGYLTGTRIPEAIRELVTARLVGQRSGGWVLTPEGFTYRATADIPFAI